MESGIKKRKLEESELMSSGDTGGVEQQQDQLLDREDVSKLLEPLDREGMLGILQAACLQHPDVLQEVRRYVDRDPIHRKLYIRGLGWDTTNDTLKSVFSAYGELQEAIVIRDKATNKSRGFGFIIFRHMDGALRALREPSKRIDGRVTVCQFAAQPWGSPVPEDVAARKIYVGNVPLGASVEKLLATFSQFGEIAEGPLGFDKTTGCSKGFALIIYKTPEGARKALAEPHKTIEGQQVHCKLAAEGQKNKPPPPQEAQAELTNRAAAAAPPPAAPTPAPAPGYPGVAYGQPGPQPGVFPPFVQLPPGANPRLNFPGPQVTGYPPFYGSPAPPAGAAAPGVGIPAVAPTGHHHYAAYANAQHPQHQQLSAPPPVGGVAPRPATAYKT